jgi:hypothetical protein
MTTIRKGEVITIKHKPAIVKPIRFLNTNRTFYYNGFLFPVTSHSARHTQREEDISTMKREREETPKRKRTFLK